MSKKKPSVPSKPPTIITITLSETTVLPRVGQLLIQRGTLATVRQFSYSSISDMTLAIQQAAEHLHTIEQAPPVLAPEGSSVPTEPAAIEELPDEPDEELDDEAVSEAPCVVPTVKPSQPPVVAAPLHTLTPAASGQMNLL